MVMRAVSARSTIVPSRWPRARWIGRAFRNLAAFSGDGALHFICMDWRHIEELMAAGHGVYGELKNLCVWVKDNAGMGSLYRSQHELVFVFKQGRDAHRNNVQLGQFGRNRSNVWLDAFLGSGTTVMAAERTGRRCYGLELDPAYVDTIVRRWQALIGGSALHAASGRSFDDLAREAEATNAA